MRVRHGESALECLDGWSDYYISGLPSLLKNYATDRTVFGLNQVAANIAAWGKRKKFDAPHSIEDDVLILAKLMLIDTEIAEAYTALKSQDGLSFRYELADIVIRVLHLAGSLRLDLEDSIATWEPNSIRSVPETLVHDVFIVFWLMDAIEFNAEAAESVRNHNVWGLVNTLAHLLMTIFVLAGGLRIDLAASIARKMAINENRPDKHGHLSGV